MNDQTAKQPQIMIQRLYIKDASFETPLGVNVFQKPWKPKFTQQVQMTHLLCKDAES